MNFLTFNESSTGNIRFTYKNVTDTLNIDAIENVRFGVYPNPAPNKIIDIVYDK